MYTMTEKVITAKQNTRFEVTRGKWYAEISDSCRVLNRATGRKVKQTIFICCGNGATRDAAVANAEVQYNRMKAEGKIT